MKEMRWHSAIRSYVVYAAGLNLLWEIVQLPFYTIWRTSSKQDILFAVLHCTAGDVIIAITALVLGVIILGKRDWPKKRNFSVNCFVVITGLLYTIYSEQINIAKGAWAYSDLMPIIPLLNIGLTPALQWIVIPSVILWKIQKRFGS